MKICSENNDFIKSLTHTLTHSPLCLAMLLAILIFNGVNRNKVKLSLSHLFLCFIFFFLFFWSAMCLAVDAKHSVLTCFVSSVGM